MPELPVGPDQPRGALEDALDCTAARGVVVAPLGVLHTGRMMDNEEGRVSRGGRTMAVIPLRTRMRAANVFCEHALDGQL